MANNERLLQILSNVQALSDLANSTKDADIYPVSFFSNAYDLIQTIQSDFHQLETEQVNLFAEQMKKHQALILSIHKQMRNIEEIPPATEAPHSHILENPVTVPQTVPEPVVEVPAPVVEIPVPVVEVPAPAVEIPVPVVEMPQELLPPPIPLEILSEERASTPEKESLAPIVPKKEMLKRSTISLPEPISDRILSPSSGRISKPEPPPIPEERGAITVSQRPVILEGSVQPSLNDVIEKSKLSDLRKAFSLNDRFRYRRELFGGNEDLMNKAIITLNTKDSYKASLQFLEETLHWDFTDPTVKDFLKILEIRFM